MYNFLVLAGESTETPAGNSMILLIVQLGILGLLFYFLLIRPQKKQQKQMQAMLSSLEKETAF